MYQGAGAPTFVELAAPSDDELHTLLQALITRLMKLLTHQGVLVEDILERPVIEKILTHLGLDPQPPPKGRAREAGHAVAA